MIFDLVIPFYNPSAGWEKKFVDKFNKLVAGYFKGDKELINLVIVNDGSSKNFGEQELNYLKVSIPHIEIVSYTQNRGKGYALREGVKKASTDYCIYSDYDFPFGLQVVRDMYNELTKGTDITTGCRRKGNYFNALPFKRKLVSKGLIVFNKQILRLPVEDTQAGIKGFNKYGKALFLQTTIDRFLFDMEFILLASKIKDINIKALSVSITHETHLSDFGMKVMRQEFKNLLKIVFRKKNEIQFKKDIIQYRPGRV
ncbi:MAG: glycosyltransferase family 2 protein [Bacteroidetes bacterium]|nr:glycosyltransferase family 2 protein [Bacteroidota bacterium]